MDRKKAVYLVCFVLLSTMVSCLEMGTQVVDWMSASEGETEVKGKYHILEEDGIRVFLPQEFKRYSMAEYQAVLRKLLPPEELKLQLANLDQKRNMDGQLYMFFEENSHSTCSVNTTKFMPMTKHEAKQLLGIMRIGNEKNLDIDTEYTKVTAKYAGTPENYFFKSVYRIHSEKKNLEVFNSVYIVTRNDKTVIYHLVTPINVYFDPFVSNIEL